MESSKVTAIATSVIAISIVGFLFNQIYNNSKNIKARCTATYSQKLFKADGFYEESYVYDQYEECLGGKGNYDDLIRYKIDNPDKFRWYKR